MSDLTGVLHDRLRAARSRPSAGDVRSCALEAAVELEREQRGWALVRLGAALRAEGSHDAALRVLDAAVALEAGADVQRAAYTVAAAVHCDRGDPRVALRVAEDEAAIGVDRELLRVLARASWQVQRETRDPADSARWRRYADALEGLGADSSITVG